MIPYSIWAELDDAHFVTRVVMSFADNKPHGGNFVRVPDEPFAGGPVCAGWMLRGGRFHSPPDETGFSAFHVAASPPQAQVDK